MEIQGEKTLAADRETVWRALNNPAVLQRCLPGCDTFESDGENRYRVAMQATVGPVRARFAGKLALSDINAPTSYALSFEGSGGVAGFGKGTATVALDDVPEGTRLRYTAKAQVGGRLAQVGSRLIDGVTRRMADDFFTRFAKELSGTAAPAQAAAGAAAGARADHASAAAPVTPAATHAPVAAVQSMPVAAVAPAATSTSTLIAVVAAAVASVSAAVSVLAVVVLLNFSR